MKNFVSHPIAKFSIVFAVVLFSMSSACAAVVLDRTFGANGVAMTRVGSAAQAKTLVIQPDGKIVAIGDFFRDPTKRDVAVIRYNSDGSLDASFGGGGKVFTAISNTDDLANAVALQPDGKIVIAGATQASGSASGDFLVARYNSNGSLDTNFGTGGVVAINQGTSDVFNAVAVQPDGKIVAAGRTSDGDRAAVARFNSNGSMDSSFGGGFVYFNYRDYKDNNFQTIGLLSGGRIVVGGVADQTFSYQSTYYAQFLVAFESNGAVAQDFGFQGVVGGSGGLPPIPNYPIPTRIKLVISTDGKITATTQIALQRYLSDGSGDTNFRGGFGGSNIVILSDGRFVITNVGRDQKDLSRQGNESGLYSNNGRFIGYSNNFGGADIAAQADNKIISVGSINDGNFYVTRISAITSQGTRIANFQRSVMVYRPSNRALYVLQDNGYNFAITTATEATRNIPEFFGSNGYFPPPNLVYWQAPNVADSPAYFRGDLYYGGAEDSFQWGLSGDIPVGGDYNGDKRTDFTVFRPSQGTWYISPSNNPSQLRGVQWGVSGDKPVPADYDYDGITDVAIYRPSTGTWWVRRSSDDTYFAVQFGIASDIPLTGDYDGDGRADFVVYRPSNGTWYELLTTEGFRAIQFGISTDVPVPGDYDGDGRHDIAVFRQGIWYLLESTEGFKGIQWGISTDVPVSVRYDE